MYLPSEKDLELAETKRQLQSWQAACEQARNERDEYKRAHKAAAEDNELRARECAECSVRDLTDKPWREIEVTVRGRVFAVLPELLDQLAEISDNGRCVVTLANVKNYALIRERERQGRLLADSRDASNPADCYANNGAVVGKQCEGGSVTNSGTPAGKRRSGAWKQGMTREATMMKPVNPRTGPAGTAQDICHANKDAKGVNMDNAGQGEPREAGEEVASDYGTRMRASREAAVEAWYGPNPPRVALAVRDVIRPWVETGKLVHDGSPIASLVVALQRIADGFAAAERRGIAASLEVVRTKQLEWHSLHTNAVICVADGSAGESERSVIAAAGNALYEACDRINALLAKVVEPRHAG